MTKGPIRATTAGNSVGDDQNSTTGEARCPVEAKMLLASISHEINLITAVTTSATAALRWLAAHPPDFEEAKKALGQIIKDGNQAGEIMRRRR